jgi:glutaredoxin-related protein
LKASANPLIATAAKGMSLLAPVFKVEASIQAKLLGGDAALEQAKQELAAAKKQNKVLVYTYGLSPFSTEALRLLDESGYPYTKVEVGAEWFLLGGQASALRQVLGAEVADGATSLPKIFIGGNCIGGCAELTSLIESGDLDAMMKKARVFKKKMGKN